MLHDVAGLPSKPGKDIAYWQTQLGQTSRTCELAGRGGNGRIDGPTGRRGQRRRDDQ